MKKIIIILFVCFGFVVQVLAQSDVFTVISSKDVVMKKGGSWTGLTVGSKLKSDDMIKANAGGVANFLHASGKVVKFNDTKEITVADFEKGVKPAADNGLAGQLLATMNNKISRSSNVSSSVAGATRATESIAKDIFFITPRRGTKILNNMPVFTWNSVQNESEYQLIVLTEDLNPIKSFNLKDTSYTYSKDDPALEQGQTYVCIVKPGRSGKQSEYQTFTILNDEENKTIKMKLDETDKLLVDAEKVTKYIIHATACEDLNLYSDAYFDYVNAIKLAPKEKAYKKMLFDYLLKVNLLKQASYLSGYSGEKEQK